MWSIVAVNTVLIGLLTLSFAQGPYSSWDQELWYRYGSLSFLFAGVVFPAIALLTGASRSRRLLGMLATWLAAVFIAFVYYAMMSGGGV